MPALLHHRGFVHFLVYSYLAPWTLADTSTLRDLFMLPHGYRRLMCRSCKALLTWNASRLAKRDRPLLVIHEDRNEWHGARLLSTYLGTNMPLILLFIFMCTVQIVIGSFRTTGNDVALRTALFLQSSARSHHNIHHLL